MKIKSPLAGNGGEVTYKDIVKKIPPYAEFLMAEPQRDEEDQFYWRMPFRGEVIGRPGFLHDGAIAGLLEIAAVGALYEVITPARDVRLKPINVAVQFLRAGEPKITFAAAGNTAWPPCRQY